MPLDSESSLRERGNVRSRLVSSLLIIVVVVVGLYARSNRASADPSTPVGFLATYAGDTLWAVLFFLLGRVVFLKANRWKLAICVLLLTLAIEFGQLWHPAWLEWLRHQPGIGFVLGNSFGWSDVICLLVGTALAVLIDMMMVRVDGMSGSRNESV